SIVGVNNAGKSSLLKFFHEFRYVFNWLSSPTGNLINALTDTERSISISFLSVKDRNEIFYDHNDRDLEMELTFQGEEFQQRNDNLQFPNKVVLKISRVAEGWTLKLCNNNQIIDFAQRSPQFTEQTKLLGINNAPAFDLKPLFDCLRSLMEILYIGPF